MKSIVPARGSLKPLALLFLAIPHAPSFAADAPVEEIIVRSARPGEKPILRDEVVATESFTATSIERSGAVMLTEALDKRPGVAVQTECSICNVRNVVLNNLPGRYTTLMIDGIPIFSSVSTAYGLDSVSLGGIERIDVSRGAGASLIAPEALSGAVNIVTRRPTENEFQVRQQFGSFGQRNTDLYAAKALTEGAVSASYQNNRHKTVDIDGNRLSEYTGFEREMFGLGAFTDNLGGFRFRGRLDQVNEKRMGGALGNHYDAVKSDGTGNPFDWSQGPHASPDPAGWNNPDGSGIVPYGDGLAGMSEIIFTDRTQLVGSGTRRLGDGTLRLALGYANHKQDSFYEKSLYRARQNQYYLEASTQQPWADSLVTMGFSYRYEDLKSNGFSAANNAANNGIDNYAYRTPGLFLQGWKSFLDGTVEANAALRLDRNNIFGSITSPRVNVLWNHSAELNSRIALGKGYRLPTSFFEQDHGILDTTTIQRDISSPEISRNASYTLSYAADRLSWTGGLNWNVIHHMVMLSPDATTGITTFSSAPNPVTVKSMDFTLAYKLLPTLDGTAGLEKSHYRFDPGTLAFARPEEKVYLRLDYDSGPWNFMSRATWTGRQDLARFYDYANTPRYNLDGSRKMDKSPSFWVVDLRGEYRLNKQWSFYAGADNLFDFTQGEKESFLWLDGSGGIDVTHLWGPSRGRFIYGGVKFSL